MLLRGMAHAIAESSKQAASRHTYEPLFAVGLRRDAAIRAHSTTAKDPRSRAPSTHPKSPLTQDQVRSLRKDERTTSKIPIVDAAAVNSTPTSSSLLQRYLPRLHDLSQRTGTPLPSLAISFLILHELTAILPLFLFWWIFQALGLGAGIVGWLASVSQGQRPSGVEGKQGGGDPTWDWRKTVEKWMEEGSKRVEKVGKRYGILGYSKTSKETSKEDSKDPTPMPEDLSVVLDAGSPMVAEKVASAIAAYVAVKALLPLRIAASIGLAPAFARFALNPIQRLVQRVRGTTR
ncbi:hypothetical protein BD324DRAFT_654120 [Kockovaella imperatae]|uniref:Uncharacterized protein n=1 Tax=Kockovaella imperatae TaxID=4999 RepID=A0A1Y1U7L7_9TREE|nr:hypothetical protein BD324DRAFT_654120 [Kockovaella imperatae]ORX33534.1 hypothetical protein BD324DRAFT_654120 [Kockovaella imperatae]